MSDERKELSGDDARTSSLTRGLARNTIFNLIGWIWPIGLSLLSVPFIVRSLGNDAYGIFAIVSLIAGYLALLYSPVAMGNVRFMAEAFAQQRWSELREAAAAGLAVNLSLSALGSLLMALSAERLAVQVFSVPQELIQPSVTSFRLAAVSFFLNGIIGALEGIPIAIRRYDIRNIGALTVGTLNTAMILLALLRGGGLLGAVQAQVLSSFAGMVLFSLIAWMMLRKLPGTQWQLHINSTYVRRLISFSSLLFSGQVVSQLGLQVDRLLVGILLGTSSVTYYMVPTKITDRIPGMMYVFSNTLYPLSSEALATNKLAELRRLYQEMIRILLWLSAFAAVLLIVLSKDFLSLWIGDEFMMNSWLVLALLAAGVVWRSSGTIAFQVCNGMGRADVTLWASIGTTVLMILSVIMFAPLWGAPGAAFGVLIGLFISNLGYDLFTQRKLLGVKRWSDSLMPYARTLLTEVGTIVIFYFLPLPLSGWGGLLTKMAIVSFLYFGWSLGVGALTQRDIKFVLEKTSRIFSLFRRGKVIA